MSKQNAYEKVTARMIEAMGEGTVPWKKMWTSAGCPVSYHGHEYRGINALVLGFTAFERGYQSNVWVTFNQVKKAGGRLVDAKGKGVHVILWKRCEKKDEPGEFFLYATTFVVFNFDHVEGIDCPKRVSPLQSTHTPDERADALVAGYAGAPKIAHSVKHNPCYVPSKDTVRMPAPECFTASNEYYSTLFHELTHSTGSESRLGREGITGEISFGSDRYSKEELIAELGAAILCSVAGVENSTTWNNSAAYLRNWHRKLKEDPKLLVQAASQAQKAVDHIVGNAFEIQEAA